MKKPGGRVVSSGWSVLSAESRQKGGGGGGRLELVFALIPVFSAVLGNRQLQVVGGWFVCVGVLVYNTPLITRAVIVAICP